MRKCVAFVMLVLLSLSLVSAYGYYDGYSYKEKIVETKYYPQKSMTYSRTTYINYDNEKRYSTYDYRHGYSYRTSVEYLDKYKDRLKVTDYDYRKYDYSKRDYDYRDYDYRKRDYDYRDYDKKYDDYAGRKGYYFEYVPHLRKYRGKECYHTPPRDKLFYIKCP